MKKLSYALIFLSIAITVVFVALTLTVFSQSAAGEDTFTIKVDNEVQKELSFEATNLKPGEPKEFTLYLKSELGGNYNVRLDFVESEIGQLKQFITVQVETEGFTAEENLLLLLTGDGIDFDCEISTQEAREVKIRYLLDASVGNEAQGEKTKFDLAISLSQK